MSQQTFILSFNSNEMINANGVYTTNVNIPDARLYKNFKAYIKDFYVLRVAGVDVLYKLRSSTIRFLNSFDTRTLSVSSQLCVVHNLYPLITNVLSEVGFDIPSINGNHSFSLEMDTGIAQTVSNNNWFLTLVVIAY